MQNFNKPADAFCILHQKDLRSHTVCGTRIQYAGPAYCMRDCIQDAVCKMRRGHSQFTGSFISDFFVFGGSRRGVTIWLALSHLKSFHTSAMPPRGRPGLSTIARKRAKADAAKAKADAVRQKAAAEEAQAAAAAAEAAAEEERKEQEEQAEDEELEDMVISNQILKPHV